MTWAKLDDQAWKSDKLLRLSKDARLLWVFGLSFVGEGWPANGGEIGTAQAEALARMQGVRAAAIAELLEYERWEITDDGRYHVHDVERFMPPKDLKSKRSEAGRLGALVTNSNRPANAAANSRQESGKASAQGIPIPVPVTRTRVAKATTSKPPPGAVDSFVVTWNGHCDPLPTLRKPPTGANDVRLMAGAVDFFDGDLALLGKSIARAALDPHYREHRYGFETYCRHIGRWGDAPVVAVMQPGDAQRAAAFDERWAAMVAKGPGPDPRSSVTA